MTDFIIQQIYINDVNKFNSNNHWINNIKPFDYIEQIEKCNTSKWIHLFERKYKKIIINDYYTIKWLLKASIIYDFSKIFSNLFNDDLNDLIQKHISLFKDNIGYFVRSEHVSLKYGKHKLGPYFNLNQIIESVISCKDGHKPLNYGIEELILYLFEWKNIEPYNEFRVFVYNNKITAISQQQLYQVYNILDINNKLNLIVDYFNSTISKKINFMSSYIYDFAILENNDILEPYFIEINPFGKEYGSGSALFHWINDENILYGKNNNEIYFRLVRFL